LSCGWTPIQKQRLIELNASDEQQEMLFQDIQERNRTFQELEQQLVKKGKMKLNELKEIKRRPALAELESKLVDVLTEKGFVQVVTPIILAKGLLAKMSIDDNHPLYAQVFWIDEKKCLRPMLAPNLYSLWRELIRLWEKPIKIFEVGSCFRKESQGQHHLNEFTMLNVTELGLPLEKRKEWLEEMTELIMKTAGISDYSVITESSVVYGETYDVVSGIELGSGAFGPHPLDQNWGIIDPWVGIGFGLERLLMVREGGQNIHRMAKSITYLDGVRLNI
jgi:pyrrolysyl-tRNA synthetase-like protein